MPFTTPDQVPGPDEKVIVGPFEATVVDRFSSGPRIELSVDGVNLLIPLQYLSKPIPYTDQEVYVDSTGTYFAYVAPAGQPLVQGVWYGYDVDDQSYDTTNDPDSFNYPSRPLRKVTFGPALND